MSESRFVIQSEAGPFWAGGRRWTEDAGDALRLGAGHPDPWVLCDELCRLLWLGQGVCCSVGYLAGPEVKSVAVPRLDGVA